MRYIIYRAQKVVRACKVIAVLFLLPYKEQEALLVFVLFDVSVDVVPGFSYWSMAYLPVARTGGSSANPMGVALHLPWSGLRQ